MADQPAVQQGIELKLDDGSVIKAENVEEALKMAMKMKVDTASALKTEREQREQLQSRLDVLEAENQRRNQPASDPNAFNRDQYFRLVGEDPIAAQNYLDAYRFGIGNPAEVPNYFIGIDQRTSRMEQEALAANFVNLNPDFPASMENAELLVREVQRLRGEGHAVDMETMKMAWRNCVATGTIKPIEEPEIAEEPNPSLSGGGAGTLDAESSRIEADVYSGKMSTGDFEKYLRSKGMLG
ncbi:MAG TPA: hypothetical protein VF748_16130 [Candidatus Acidoferrum sp.]